MKYLIFLTFISLVFVSACSAKNENSAKNTGSLASASQAQKQDSVIEGSIDKSGKIVMTFEQGSAEISGESEDKIKELADYLKNNTSVTMNVPYHETDDENFAYLSRQRAKNISDKIKDHGVDESRIRKVINTEGYYENEADNVDIELVH
ncbi:MAG: OmpA family protein [Endomicrobia bacterium]|jgi:outer membrane protein OmpA-like peptidoglycan-associated protein|nr:OmpA family protein [Endomicrobiia bacterium]